MEVLQFTLFSTTGKYKPMTTFIRVESVEEYKNNKKKFQQRAIAKICSEKKTTQWAMKANGYTQMKVRIYPKSVDKSK